MDLVNWWYYYQIKSQNKSQIKSQNKSKLNPKLNPKLQLLGLHFKLSSLSSTSPKHWNWYHWFICICHNHTYASITQLQNTGDIVIEMTNLKHQNPQSVGVMASSGWCEHYLVCRRLLTILRGKGRNRQFAIPPRFSTQNRAPPINVLSSDRCNWVGVFTVIAKDILAISENFFCTKKKYVFHNLKWN